MSDRWIELGVALETMSIIDTKELQGLKYDSDFLSFLRGNISSELMELMEAEFTTVLMHHDN